MKTKFYIASCKDMQMEKLCRLKQDKYQTWLSCTTTATQLTRKKGIIRTGKYYRNTSLYRLPFIFFPRREGPVAKDIALF